MQERTLERSKLAEERRINEKKKKLEWVEHICSAFLNKLLINYSRF